MFALHGPPTRARGSLPEYSSEAATYGTRCTYVKVGVRCVKVGIPGCKVHLIDHGMVPCAQNRRDVIRVKSLAMTCTVAALASGVVLRLFNLSHRTRKPGTNPGLRKKRMLVHASLGCNASDFIISSPRLSRCHHDRS